MDTLEFGPIYTLLDSPQQPAQLPEAQQAPRQDTQELAVSLGALGASGSCPTTNHCVWHGCSGACR